MDLRNGKSYRSLLYLSQPLKLFLLGTLAFSFVFFLNHFHLSNYFPIKTVRVYGVTHVDKQEVQEVLTPLVNRGFFGINVDFIRDRLLQIPWVTDIFVRRNWPDQVEVTIIEKKPAARWNKQSLLSVNGEVFTPKLDAKPISLPVFLGPDGKQIFMLQYFNQINRLLLPLHAKVTYLELTPYLTWNMTLTNGITLRLGHKDILTRLNHFVKVYPKIVGNRATDVDYVDLRYPNGMAVRWKTAVKV